MYWLYNHPGVDRMWSVNVFATLVRNYLSYCYLLQDDYVYIYIYTSIYYTYMKSPVPYDSWHVSGAHTIVSSYPLHNKAIKVIFSSLGWNWLEVPCRFENPDLGAWKKRVMYIYIYTYTYIYIYIHYEVCHYLPSSHQFLDFLLHSCVLKIQFLLINESNKTQCCSLCFSLLLPLDIIHVLLQLSSHKLNFLFQNHR